MSSGLPTIETQFGEFSTRVQAEIDQLSAQERETQALLADIRQTKGRYERVLRVLSPETSKPKSHKKGRPKNTISKGPRLNHKVSIERADAVVAVIQNLDIEEFSVGDVGEAMGLDPNGRTKVYDTFNALREIEYLGKVGHRSQPGRPAVFRVLDADALERFKEGPNA